MKCRICQKEFIPNKYHPHQRVCSRPECQHLRQILNERDWRNRNPEYFKCRGQEIFWRESRHRYSQQWRKAHQEYLKRYRKEHSKQRREYMREYMRRYRALSHKQRFVNRNKS